MPPLEGLAVLIFQPFAMAYYDTGFSGCVLKIESRCMIAAHFAPK
jgi:hypothetical protein